MPGQEVKTMPGNWAVEYSEGIRQLECGDYEGAVAAFTSVIAVNPDLLQAYRDRAEAHRGLGRIEEAEADEEKGRALLPTLA